MRAGPAGQHIPVTTGDMATAYVDGGFRLVVLVFNTINNLTTQEAPVACFKNAARPLIPGGHFVVEEQILPIHRLPEGGRLLAFACDAAIWVRTRSA